MRLTRLGAPCGAITAPTHLVENAARATVWKNSWTRERLIVLAASPTSQSLPAHGRHPRCLVAPGYRICD